MAASVPSGTTLLLISLLVFLHLGFSITSTSAVQSNKSERTSRRNLVLKEDEEEPPLVLNPPPKKKPTLETKTKSIKSTKPKNSTSTTTASNPITPSKLNTTLNPTLQTKNQTKLLKPKKSNSTTTTTTTTKTKIKLSKLNTTLNSTNKPTNSTKLPKLTNSISKSNSTKLPKLTNSISKSNATKLPKLTNSISKSNSTKLTKSLIKSNTTKTQEAKPLKSQKNTLARDTPPTSKSKPATNFKPKLQQTKKQATTDSDLIADFRDLPSRLLPDLEQLSITSKAYISIASRHITKGVKPYVGNKHAPAVAAAASVVVLAFPLLLLTLALRCLNTHLSLQQALVFAQAYLAIYFATLALAAVATGLEPLRFLYATAPSSYACMQAFQAVGYIVYLLVQVVVVVTTGGGARLLGVMQMIVGLAVGLHYYTVVLHRAVAGEPPRAGWKVHAAYAACFVVICGCARAQRRKKAYLLDGGEGDGKKS